MWKSILMEISSLDCKQIKRLITGRNKLMGLSISESSALSQMKQKSRSQITTLTNYTKGSFQSSLHPSNKENNIRGHSAFYHQAHPVKQATLPTGSLKGHTANKQGEIESDGDTPSLQKLKDIRRQIQVSEKVISNEKAGQDIDEQDKPKVVTQQLRSLKINCGMRPEYRVQFDKIAYSEQQFDQQLNSSLAQTTRLRNIHLSNKFAQMESQLTQNAQGLHARGLKTIEMRTLQQKV